MWRKNLVYKLILINDTKEGGILLFYSIVVPVYNVEYYLSECIESVLSQKHKDFELILVNDGSTDESGIICDNYAKKDDRIKVIHKKNGGVSDARNIGIENTKGDYLVFLDADDYMEESALLEIENKVILDQSQVIMFSYNTLIGNKSESVHINYNNNITIPLDFIKYAFQSNKTTLWASWLSIYQVKFIKENDLKFEKGISCSEDCDWFMKCILAADSISGYDVPIYNYRTDREGSATNLLSEKHIYSQLYIYSKWFKFFKENNNIKNNEFFYNYFADRFINVFATINHIDDKDRLHKIMKENKNIINYGYRFKNKIYSLFIRVLGVELGCKILGKIRNKLVGNK